MDNIETTSLEDLANSDSLNLKTAVITAVVIVGVVVVTRKALAWKRSRSVAVQTFPGSQES